ncbi:hypothetical protein BGW80DRAFT_1381985, partial [Lactifluus volemus]
SRDRVTLPVPGHVSLSKHAFDYFSRNTTFDGPSIDSSVFNMRYSDCPQLFISIRSRGNDYRKINK